MEETVVSSPKQKLSPKVFRLLFSAICWTKVSFQIGAQKKEQSEEMENRLN